ncbi:MAG: disulfide bond formation protein B [Rhodospirillales bacterium]|nr:disulfide bond formation protein B [Rhodospirillales bacterium]
MNHGSSNFASRLSGNGLLNMAPPAVGILCLGTLGVALIAEHAFGLQPCSLCRYQQIVYGVVAAIAFLAMLGPAETPVRWVILGLSGLGLMGGSGLAFYHVGVEQHWWGSQFCAGGVTDVSSMSFTDLTQGLGELAEKPCDEVDWTLFGISMATYNVGVYLVYGFTALLFARLGLREA